jgi:membrane-associated phospholipid phosphatase
MTDIPQIPAYAIALAGLVAMAVSALKPAIEKVLPPANKWHDLFFILLPAAFSMAACVGYTLRHPPSDIYGAVGWGIGAALLSNGQYLLHTRTRGREGEPGDRGQATGDSGDQRAP